MPMAAVTIQALLSRRLDEAEQDFVEGKYGLCLEATQGILRDMMAMTSVPDKPAGSKSRPSLQHDQHLCADGCVCQAAVVLCMQALFEMHRYSLIDDLILTYYNSFTGLPYEVFLAW